MKGKIKILSLLLIISMMAVMVGCGSEPAVEETDIQVESETSASTDADSQASEEWDPEPVEVVDRGEAFEGAEYTEIDGDKLATIQEEVRKLTSVKEAYLDGELVGYEILVKPNGYKGEIEIFTYMDLDGDIVQVDIGEHHESAGVGDQIEIPDFLNGFNGVNSAEGVSGVDALAGATFSSGGVKDGVTRALTVFSHLQ